MKVSINQGVHGGSPSSTNSYCSSKCSNISTILNPSLCISSYFLAMKGDLKFHPKHFGCTSWWCGVRRDLIAWWEFKVPGGSHLFAFEISQGRHVATSNTSPAQVAQKTWQPLNPRILGLECHPNLSCASSFISFFNSVLCFTMKQCLRWEYPASKDGVASRNICHPQRYNLQKWLLGGLTWNNPKKLLVNEDHSVS